MARIGRIVVPGLPHHVTQRGNRRQPVFFSEKDKRLYLRILREQSMKHGLEIWTYCLMDNHVHLIVVPKTKKSLPSGIGETHQRYTRHVNSREGWKGYLWQGRFSSFPLGEEHLFAAVRYVECNPVRAKMVSRAEDYPWSSARCHIQGKTGKLLTKSYIEDAIPDWRSFLGEAERVELFSNIRSSIRTGRPLGDEDFIHRLESLTCRKLRKQKPGPKPRN